MALSFGSLAPAAEACVGCVCDELLADRIVGGRGPAAAGGCGWQGGQVVHRPGDTPGLGGAVGLGFGALFALAAERPLAALAFGFAVALGASGHDFGAIRARDVLRFHLAVVVLRDFLLDLLALVQAAEPFRLDRRLVYEHVFAAVGRRDEAEALVVEPQHFAGLSV